MTLSLLRTCWRIWRINIRWIWEKRSSAAFLPVVRWPGISVVIRKCPWPGWLRWPVACVAPCQMAVKYKAIVRWQKNVLEGPENWFTFMDSATVRCRWKGAGYVPGIRAMFSKDFSVQRHTNQCGSRPDRVSTKGAFWCREWTRCQSQMPIRLCLHAGGHGIPKNWLEEGLTWLHGDQ